MAEDPNLQAEQQETTPELPDWVEERFRSAENPVEAQARSYAEAQREMNRVRSESERQQREFSEALASLSAQPEPQQQYAPQQDPLLQAAQRAYEEGDVTTLLAIQAQISQAATAQIGGIFQLVEMNRHRRLLRRRAEPISLPGWWKVEWLPSPSRGGWTAAEGG